MTRTPNTAYESLTEPRRDLLRLGIFGKTDGDFMFSNAVCR